LEKAGQGRRRFKPYFLWVLAILAIAGAVWALIYVPKMFVPVCPPGKEGLPPKICFDIENEARKTLAYIMGGILAIIGIYMAHRRIRALEQQVRIGQEQLQVAQEGQITERFTRAIEQLSSDRMEVRLGGIYALERIANDSDKDYWPIMETLTAYVRENAPWREPPPEASEETGEEKAAAPSAKATPTPAPAATLKPATDIQAVLTVLGRRKYYYGQGEKQPLDMRGTDLRGADLREANLVGAFLMGAHIEGALFEEAHLEEAILEEAHLQEADLFEVHLEGADLSGAYLEGAFFVGAHLKGAVLMEARLEKANLFEADLENADLGGGPPGAGRPRQSPPGRGQSL
jgi:hypothetical protein